MRLLVVKCAEKIGLISRELSGHGGNNQSQTLGNLHFQQEATVGMRSQKACGHCGLCFLGKPHATQASWAIFPRDMTCIPCGKAIMTNSPEAAMTDSFPEEIYP